LISSSLSSTSRGRVSTESRSSFCSSFPEGSFEPLPMELGAVLGVSGVLMFAFVLIAGPLVEAAGAAAHSLF